MSNFATLRTLHSLIGDALNDIERAFAEHDTANSEPGSSTNTKQTDFPSPYSPYDANSTAESLLTSDSLIQTSKLVVSACGQLTAMVQRPFLTICDATLGYHLPACMRFLEASHTVEILKQAGPEGLHVDEIAKQANCDPSKLSHVLRLLASHHIGQEVSPDVFANNRLSSLVDSGKSLETILASPHEKYEGTDGVAAFVGMCSDELFKSAAYMTEAFLQNESSKFSSDLSAAPFNLAFKTEQPFFPWLEEPGHEWRLARFGRAMMGTAGYMDSGSAVDAAGFDWSSVLDNGLVVDVGGGIGSASMALARKYPHLRFCVQDRPKVVEIGQQVWKDQCSDLIENERATLLGHDFFNPQPVQDASVFLVRVVTHDWPDALVNRILIQLRHAAKPYTKLVLMDYLLPLACEDNTGSVGSVKTLAPAGSGLLPNLGKANANAFWLDMTMSVTFNAKERTLDEMKKLALAAGWEINQVVRPSGSLFGSIVAVPVPIPASPKSVTIALPADTASKRSETPEEIERPSSRAKGAVATSAKVVVRMRRNLSKKLSKTFERPMSGHWFTNRTGPQVM